MERGLKGKKEQRGSTKIRHREKWETDIRKQ